jgi:hypothetical protein
MPLGLTPAHFLLIMMVAAVPIALLALLVLAARSRPPDPRVVLAGRLARGEITREEFDTAMSALGLTPDSQTAPPSGPTTWPPRT